LIKYSAFNDIFRRVLLKARTIKGWLCLDAIKLAEQGYFLFLTINVSSKGFPSLISLYISISIKEKNKFLYKFSWGLV